MIIFLILLLSCLTLIFFSYLFKDLIKNKDTLEKQTSYFMTGIIGFVTNFFDTLWIGSFAALTAILRGLT